MPFMVFQFDWATRRPSSVVENSRTDECPPPWRDSSLLCGRLESPNGGDAARMFASCTEPIRVRAQPFVQMTLHWGVSVDR